MKIEGYINPELLVDSGKSKVYRIYQEGSKKPFILKTPGSELSDDKAKVFFNYEFGIGSKLGSDFHLKYIKCSESNGMPYILMEDFGAVSLKHLIPEKGFDIDTFLNYSVKIARALAQLHQKKIIHKDICTSNIAVNPVSGDLKLIDFGSASNFSKEIGDNNSLWNHATLAFISPEQTGRINRLVTYKTDFYSLGVVFYQMLTGQLPFQSDESSELIYQHIAGQPPHIKQINPLVPVQLNDIVVKLMKKNPDERYNSAIGLLSDLEKSLEMWKDANTISIFPLGENDVSEVFTIPEKLFGREDELTEVKAYFNRALEGNFTVCYIEGHSGIGKSAFVTELYKDIIKEKGKFGIGKFDQFQRNVPYSALIQALKQIIQQILIESKESIAKWKSILWETLGSNAGLLVAVLPELELVMGKLDAVDTSDPSLTKNRFVTVFKNLIKSFSQPKAPLVLFLDDLQWVDSATLQLFTDFFNSLDRDEENYTLIIGAYRDNEVGADHPLEIVLRDFENRGFPRRTIKLGPLKEEATNEFCAESLSRTPEETTELGALLHAKTGGSPLFIKQFLENLYERGLVYLDHKAHNWSWQLDKVKESSFTDNVLDLIQKKLRKLNENEQSILKVASCLGQNFESAEIVQITQLDDSVVEKSLERIMAEDIIYKLYDETGKVYRFQHDRIQDAAYQLIEEKKLNELHYQIGKFIIEQPNILEKNPEKLFKGLEHLNKNESLVTDESLRFKLAKYNLVAGQIARKSNAYQAALNYVKKGINFMASDKWKAHYELSRGLHLIGAQSAYLIGNYKEMHHLSGQALPNLSNPIDKADFHEIITYSYASRREWENAVREVIRGLDILKIKLPSKPNTFHVVKHLTRFFVTMRGRKLEKLIDLPDLNNPRVESAIKLLISGTSAAYLTNQNMFAIFFIEMARLSAKHGNSKYSSFSYVGFGVFMGGGLGFIDYGFRFSELGKKVFEKYPSNELQAKLYFSLYAFSQNWKIDVKLLYPKLLEAFQVGSQVGENEYAAWCFSIRAGMSTLSGENLQQVEQDLLAAVKYSEHLKQIQIISTGFLHYTQWWLDKGEPVHDPLLDGFVDQKAPVFENEKFWTALAEHDLMYGSMLFYYAEYEKAWKYLSRGWEHHDSLIGLFYYVQLAFYRAWCAIKLQQANPKYFTSGKLKKIINDFKKWGLPSPANHGHKLTMFEAELAVLKGEREKAKDLFDVAISEAEKTNHPNDQALFCEIAAGHYNNWGKSSFAEIYVKQAYDAYLDWGAERKLRSLEKQNPNLSQALASSKRADGLASSSITTDILSTLDLDYIVKASQAISGEIQLEALLTRLLNVLTEIAGAQRVVIILKIQDQLWVEATKEIGNEVKTERTLLEEFNDLPVALINYIETTKTMVLLENALKTGPFIQDPYILKKGCKSILGIPILRQGKLSGIIYMENNLATGIFTSERADTLKALSAQVAISLENANFIGDMQELNKSYDRFVPMEFLRILDRDSILKVKPGDQKIKEMIVLFADIRDFTALCETIPASETFAMLNSYLHTVTPAIHNNGGTIDKFMGDGIMALFPNNADKALRAAVEMQIRLNEYNKERKLKNLPAIRIGIGLHIGDAILGTVGTNNRLNTTVIGDPVNLAARLEAYTKVNKVNILLSGDLAARLENPDDFNLREVGLLMAKGKSSKTELFEEFSDKPKETIELIKQNNATFIAGIKSFEKGEFGQALTQFEAYLKLIPTDNTAKYYHLECQSIISSKK